jgi:U4/U6.U5 tri-snRNP-associated protein 1
MKPKEAYRYICAKFHGEGPSKNKVEMRKKRELE